MKYFVEHSIIESPEGFPLVIPTFDVDSILDKLCKSELAVSEPSDRCVTPDDYHDTGIRFYFAVDDVTDEHEAAIVMDDARSALADYLFDMYYELLDFHEE